MPKRGTSITGWGQLRIPGQRWSVDRGWWSPCWLALEKQQASSLLWGRLFLQLVSHRDAPAVTPTGTKAPRPPLPLHYPESRKYGITLSWHRLQNNTSVTFPQAYTCMKTSWNQRKTSMRRTAFLSSAWVFDSPSPWCLQRRKLTLSRGHGKQKATPGLWVTPDALHGN